MYEIIVAVYKIVIEGTFYKCKIHGSLMVVSIKEGVQKGKIPPCRIGYLISVSNRDTNKSRVPNTFWTPSCSLLKIGIY